MTNDWLLEAQSQWLRGVGRRGSRTNGALDAFVFLLRLSKDETNDRYQSPPAGDTHETSPVGGGDDGHATGGHKIKWASPSATRPEGQLKNTYFI